MKHEKLFTKRERKIIEKIIKTSILDWLEDASHIVENCRDEKLYERLRDDDIYLGWDGPNGLDAIRNEAYRQVKSLLQQLKL